MSLPDALTEKHLGLPTWGWLAAGGALVLFVWWRGRAAATGSTSTANVAQGSQVPGQPLNFLVEPPSDGGAGGGVAAPPPLPPLAPPGSPAIPAFTQTIWGPVATGTHLNAINDMLVPQPQYGIGPEEVTPQAIAAFNQLNPGYGGTGNQPSGMGQ